MKHTVYKGLESPCMIKGFLSTDYWMYVGCLGAAVIFIVLSLRSSFQTGEWDQFLLIAACCIVVLPIIRHQLKKKARPMKFSEKKEVITINNFSITKILINREKNES